MKTIISKITILIALFVTTCMLVSCESENEKREKFIQIAESRSTADLLDDLYVGSEGDVEAIARILKCTPSSIERIRKGESSATSQFAERVVDVSVYYYVNEQSFSMLRAALDDEWGWYDDVLYFPKHHSFWFWTINILLLIGVVLVMFFSPGLFAIELIIILIEGVLILVCWIISLCISPDMIEDRYTDSINPIIEQVESYE